MEALSREWDGASKPQRLRILEHLADPSPREHFADASAQLFFLRIVTAMKIAYVVGSPISAHLTAIATFFDASLGARFQTQFVQVRVARAKAAAGPTGRRLRAPQVRGRPCLRGRAPHPIDEGKKL